MNKKNIFWIIAIVILVIISIMMFPKQETVSKSNQNITPGSECKSDNECADSLKLCGDEESSCDNGCVYGICTQCVPICPGESVCGDLTCTDSVRTCPGGRQARCANYCEENGEECTLCVPECNLVIQDKINYQVKAGKSVVDAIPCIDSTYSEREELRIIKKNISTVELPSGYSTIIEPFTVSETGPFELTLSIPETYSDVRALRCKGDECNSILIEYVTELTCGETNSKEHLRQTEYLEPKFMPIKIEEKRRNISAQQEITSNKYQVSFDSVSDILDVTLSMPNKPTEEAKNPSLKITGTPLIIKIVGGIREDVNAKVTMPYSSLEGFEENSIGMYVKIEEGWKYFGGETNKEKKTVSAIIPDVNNYLNKNNEIEIALMGILCISCYGSTLTKVYEPEGGSESAIILIHGFNPETDTFKEIINDIKLTNQPFDVLSFNYPSSKSIRDNMGEFMSLLEKNHANYKKIYLVAHSLGGLITQQTLYNSYLENEKSLKLREPKSYNYLEKIRKVILVGVSNEGSPVVDVYRNLFENLINNKEQTLFNLNSQVINDLAEGIITPRVPGIDYNVIAGTKPFKFNLLFFESSSDNLEYEKNDGVVTVKSAQNIGGEYVNNQCEDYWQVNLTHTELIDDPLSRKIIEKIISDDTYDEDTAILSRNKYFYLSADTSSEYTYVIIGKKIEKEAVEDITGCSCGNGFCGAGEDETNCPTDCVVLLSKNKKGGFWALIIVIIAAFAIYFQYSVYRRFNHPHLHKMVRHIKTNYEITHEGGYTHHELREAFLKRGWPKRIVNDTISVLKKDFHNNYHKPLKKHIREHLKKGHSESAVKDALMSAGWKGGAIDTVMSGGELEPKFRLKEKREEQVKLEGKKNYFKSSK